MTYMLQAALICNHCAAEFMANTPRPPEVIELAPGDFDETSYDSDVWPKGPYGDGGGEADCPQHCDHCGEFLNNPLTGDGETYVRDAFREYVENGNGRLDVLTEWKAAYDWVWSDFESITVDMMEEEGLSKQAKQRLAALAVS